MARFALGGVNVGPPQMPLRGEGVIVVKKRFPDGKGASVGIAPVIIRLSHPKSSLPIIRASYWKP